MNTPPKSEDWEEDKQEWLATFDKEYGNGLSSRCLGVVARALYHQQVASPGADASYITLKLIEVVNAFLLQRTQTENKILEDAISQTRHQEKEKFRGMVEELKAWADEGGFEQDGVKVVSVQGLKNVLDARLEALKD